MTYGLYRITGTRAYRGHAPGSEFVARLERGAEARAIARGDIELVEWVVPDIAPGSATLPPGWLPEPAPVHRGAERRLTR